MNRYSERSRSRTVGKRDEWTRCDAMKRERCEEEEKMRGKGGLKEGVYCGGQDWSGVKPEL